MVYVSTHTKPITHKRHLSGASLALKIDNDNIKNRARWQANRSQYKRISHIISHCGKTLDKKDSAKEKLKECKMVKNPTEYLDSAICNIEVNDENHTVSCSKYEDVGEPWSLVMCLDSPGRNWTVIVSKAEPLKTLGDDWILVDV